MNTKIKCINTLINLLDYVKEDEINLIDDEKVFNELIKDHKLYKLNKVKYNKTRINELKEINDFLVIYEESEKDTLFDFILEEDIKVIKVKAAPSKLINLLFIELKDKNYKLSLFQTNLDTYLIFNK